MTERAAIVVALLALPALLSWGCDEREGPEVGGDTHWLAACDADAQCERGRCLCGICTEPCADSGACSGAVVAECYDADSPGVERQCGARVIAEAEGICLAVCEDDLDCPQSTRCMAGACISDAAGDGSDAGTGAGMAPVIEAPALPETRAEQFADLQPEVDFDTPVAFPLPRTTMAETSDTLIGNWRERDCPAEQPAQTCLRLEIVRSDEGGTITGRLFWDPLDPVLATTRPPPQDADSWYPPDAPEGALSDLLWTRDPAIGYTMLDAELDGGRLIFWFSPLEVWSEWCALQTSYRHEGGEPHYQCIPPPDALEAATPELGKQVLCTNELSNGICELGDQPAPCNCVTDAGESSYDSPLCSPAACHCDADGCVTNWHARRNWIELRVDGDRMTVTGWYDIAPAIAGHAPQLEREQTP